MHSHFQRVMGFILTITLLLTLLPFAVFATEVDVSDGMNPSAENTGPDTEEAITKPIIPAGEDIEEAETTDTLTVGILDSVSSLENYISPYEEMNHLIKEALLAKQNTPMTIEEGDSGYLDEVQERIRNADSVWEQMQIDFPMAITTLSEVEASSAAEVHFTSGAGIEDDPFIISTVADLLEIRTVIENGISAYYKLKNDIDLSGITWTPIGDSNKPFLGYFDGNGYSILNLSINTGEERTGFFGTVTNATVTNLTIQDAEVNGSSIVGALVGHCSNSTVNNITLRHCSVSGGSFVGGLAGAILSSTVTNCSNDGCVKGSGSYTGGIVGLFDGIIEKALFTGNVEAQDWVGGIVGAIYGNADHCTNTGSISGINTVGGIAGELSYTNITREVNFCYNTGKIEGDTEIGGIAGYALSRVDTSGGAMVTGAANTGNVSASGSYAGGIFGDSACNAFVVTSYNVGNVSAKTTAGGIAGRYNPVNQYTSAVSGVYNAGQIGAPDYSGGLMGHSYATIITNSYFRQDEGEDTEGISLDRTEGKSIYTPISTIELRDKASTLHPTRFSTDDKWENKGFPILVDIDYVSDLREHEGRFHFSSGYQKYDISSTYFYYDDYFAQSPYTYNEHLATMSMSLAMSAFVSFTSYFAQHKDDVSPEDPDLKDPDGVVRQYVNAEKLLTQIGFKDISANTWYMQRPTRDSIGVIVGAKEITIAGEDVTVIAIAIRGAGYASEWAGNFNIGTSGPHSGFLEAKDLVIQHLEDCFSDKNVQGIKVQTEKVKFWITGYSRAAATANLVAAALDDGEITVPGANYGPEDVYAYTFETPQGALIGDVRDTKYDNIFNIINGNDLVTKVAPSAWGFNRYGRNIYIPTSTNSGEDYDTYLSKMLDRYNALDFPKTKEAEYQVDEIVGKQFNDDYENNDETEGTASKKGVESYKMPQEVFLNNLVQTLAVTAMESRQNYVDKFQEQIQIICEFVFGPKSTWREFGTALTDNLVKQLPLLLFALELKLAYDMSEGHEPMKALAANSDAKEIIIGIVNDSAKQAGISLTVDEIDELAQNVLDVLLKLLVSDLLSVYSALSNMNHIFQPHIPEICLAWVQSMDSFYVDTDNSVLSVHGGYRTVLIIGDYDVCVYDSEDNLVSSIVSDNTETVKDVIAGIFGIPDVKILYLPADREYKITMKAKQDGDLSYCVSEYNTLVGATTRIVDFCDVQAMSGDTFIADIPVWNEPLQRDFSHSQAYYTLKYNNTQEIAVKRELKGEEAARAYYAVNANSDNPTAGTVLGSGTRSYGSHAILTANADQGYDFAGWYSNDVLVSADEEYSFKVTSDIDVIARFEPSV